MQVLQAPGKTIPQRAPHLTSIPQYAPDLDYIPQKVTHLDSEASAPSILFPEIFHHWENRIFTKLKTPPEPQGRHFKSKYTSFFKTVYRLECF